MAITYPISKTEFKAKFPRNFVYGSTATTVMDADIDNAIADAWLLFNSALWDTDTIKTAYCYATAHFLAINVQSAGGLNSSVGSQGINNRSNGFAQAKQVGQVSVTYTDMPDIVRKYPQLYQFWETEYGKRYLAMLMPKLVGVTGIVDNPIEPDLGTPNIPFTGP